MKENIVENQDYLTPFYKLMNDLLSKICINTNLIVKNISSEILDPFQEICLNCSKANKEILAEVKNVNFKIFFYYHYLFLVFFSCENQKYFLVYQ